MNSTLPEDHEDRPPFLFCRSIESVITTCKAMTLKKTWFSDGLNGIRQQLHLLEQAASKLKLQVEAEEEKRSPFQISYDMLSELEAAKASSDEANNKIKKLEVDFEKTRDALESKKNKLTEDIVLQQSTDTVQSAKAIEAYNEAYNKLHAEKESLEEQVRSLELAIDTSCCGCFPCGAKKEKTQLAGLKPKLEGVTDKMLALENPNDNKNDSAALSALKQTLEDLTKQLETHITTFPEKLEATQHEQEGWEENYFKLDNRVKRYRMLYISAINRETLLMALRVYHLFLDLKKMISDARVSNPSQEWTANMNHLRQQINIEQLKNAFEILWCPESNDIHGLALYEKFSALSEPDRVDLLSESPQPNIVLKLLPLSRGLLLDSLNKNDFIQITLFSTTNKTPNNATVSVSLTANPSPVI
jgi:DNA repair exonuclease SbcCD ATPase subunit